MAVAIQLEYCVTPYQYPSFKSVLLLYRVNTTEPSQDAEGFQLLKTVKLAGNIPGFSYPPLICTMNDKYLIHEIFTGGKCSVEVREIETLQLPKLSGVFRPERRYTEPYEILSPVTCGSNL